MVVTSASVLNCFSAGTVTATAGIPDYVAGFCPYNDVLTEDCYYDHDNAPLDDDYATPKTTAEMKTQSTFSGWDFLSAWKLGAFAGGNRKSITNEDGDYGIPVKDGAIDVFLELDPSDGYPFLQFETKKRVAKSGATRCDWYVRGRMPEPPPTEGVMYSWGANWDGQLGNGSSDSDPHPAPTQIGSAIWKLLSAGDSHSLGIKSDGTLWAWGDNYYGQLGLGDTTNRNEPTQVGTSKWLFVSAGNGFSLGIKENGTLWAWGFNQHGGLGLGDETDRDEPTQVGSDTWIAIACGYRHALGIKTNGSLWSWGYNSVGQLGLGDTTKRNVPTQIGSATWTAIASRENHSLALKSDGTLWSCGYNYYGQLGIGNYDDKNTLQQIGSDTWKLISAGTQFSICIKSDDTLWSWGNNWAGQLGIGDTTKRNTPQQIGSEKWKAISCGSDHVMATKPDDTLWAWGDNYMGELGLGTYDYDEHSEPEQVGTAEWILVDAGGYFNLAIKKP